MNVNMNLNNMMMNQVQNNNLIVNKQTSVMDNNTFLNLLTMMADNNVTNAPITTDSTDTNNSFMQLLAGSDGMNNYLDLLNTNNISQVNTNIEDFMAESDENEQSEVDKLIEGVYMQQAYLNFITPDIAGVQVGQDNSTELVNGSFETYKPLLNYNKLPSLNQDLPQNKLNVNNGEVKIEKPVLSPQAEKLISDIESKRDKLIKDINSNIEMLLGNKTINSDQNKIIQLSDESTQIKSQVLNQVSDKIVVMTEEILDEGNAVKQVTMELNPKELGKVDIKMTIVDGKVTVEVKAQNEETQKMIASNADELLNILTKTSEKVSIVVKSNDSSYDNHLINSHDKEIQNNGENYHEDQNLDQDNRKRNYYFYDEDNKNSDDDGKFSELINLRSIKLNL